MGVKELERLEAQAEKAGAFVNDYRVVGFVFAKVVISGVIAERDALTAKLAELEGQEPVAWMTANREMTSFVNFHDDDLPLYARPVPADPVNAHLLTALIQCRDRFAFYVGHHLDRGDLEKAAENEKFVALANDAIASAESAPKAGRLTDKECAIATSEIAHVRSDDMLKIARAIETAVLRKNGLALED